MRLLISLCATALVLTVFACLYRAVAGPTVADRVVAINVIGTKTIVIMALVSHIYQRGLFLDVALVYALISFITTLAVAGYLESRAPGDVAEGEVDG